MQAISEFEGDYRFLSNFWPSVVVMDGHPYDSIEHAYQAAKTLDDDLRRPFRENVNANMAKKMGNALALRHDWEEVKLGIMKELVRNKFGNFDLMDKLLATGDAILIEGNWWHDNFWGNCSCGKCRGQSGQNNLGKTLMEIREEYRLLKEERKGAVPFRYPPNSKIVEGA